MAPNQGQYDSTTASFDEFAHPELKEYRKPSTLRQKFTRLFTDMPVFPIGMLGFCSMAGYGIWKYQRMPIKDSVSKTLYFTGLRIAAQGLAVGIIVAGAAHHVYKDYMWNKEHPGEERPRDL
ncbi:hypothetical protein RvY_08526-2 [Ramazzottius varieornatus]|uniref:HIG1 domain-containing protein n=1 Tax=Ramazzottius varieornatus TaxID=947166 RepID=A0A1D1V676_RAMVA|nr:hypothetical protein RvY_08526-2 [Ramazzottius varieornatus]